MTLASRLASVVPVGSFGSNDHDTDKYLENIRLTVF